MGKTAGWTIALFLILLPATALADPDDTLAERARILSAELRRDAAALAPFLNGAPGTALRRQAIRAVGRIGNDGNGPGIIRDVLAASAAGNVEPDLADWLWAAGIARSKELVDPLTAHLHDHLEAKRWDLAARAARALGWTGAEDVADTLLPLLTHSVAAVRVAGLEGLGRAHPKERRHLEAAVKCAGAADADVRSMADFACWLLAGSYARAQKTANKDWDGDAELAAAFYGHLGDASSARRVAGIRVLGTLLPKTLDSVREHVRVFELLKAADARVVQAAVWRIFGRRKGKAVDLALMDAMSHKDPKTRHLAVQALGKSATPLAITTLEAGSRLENDARLREVFAVELGRVGRDGAARALLAGKPRPADAVLRQMTEAELLLVSKRPEALDELLAWADPGASQRTALHAATWWTVLSGLEGREHPKLVEWLQGFLNGGYAVDPVERAGVVAAAVSLVASNKLHALSPKLLALLETTPFGPPAAELRSSLVSAFGKLAADEGCPAEVASGMKAAVRKLMVEDPSPWVRRAARAAATALKFEDVPEFDEQQPNEWKGVPRAETSSEGTDPPGGGAGPWLNEEEILRVADWIRQERPRIVFETTAGTFALELDAAAAPVHAVSLFNAVRNGVYTNTRWHRVVPNFVIQGGDPHGTGGGDAGWSVPDEINENEYVRGALGMPKSVKDDGGCQIFIMHSEYRPLNERYTCYGRVVQGMATVDRIRVGDFIRSARWEKP